MSYNERIRNGYAPSYTSQNTGAAYMASRGWDGSRSEREDPISPHQSITFHGKRTSKRLYVSLFILLCLLLIAAVVIIILFATGVLHSSNVELGSTTPFNPFPPQTQPIIGPTPGPIGPRNQTFSCSFTILRQANAAYDVKTSNNFQAAFRMVRTALSRVIGQSSLAPYGATVLLDDLSNSGNNLVVRFRIVISPPAALDTQAIANMLLVELPNLQNAIGGGVIIDPTSIAVSSS